MGSNKGRRMNDQSRVPIAHNPAVGCHLRRFMRKTTPDPSGGKGEPEKQFGNSSRVSKRILSHQNFVLISKTCPHQRLSIVPLFPLSGYSRFIRPHNPDVACLHVGMPLCARTVANFPVFALTDMTLSIMSPPSSASGVSSRS